jgi:TRAP-type C4-dicarboxylate transport system permease small subunit
MRRALHLLQTTERWIAATAFGFMTLLVLADIILREAFKQSFPLGPKLAIDLMILGGFLGAAITSGKGTHLKAEMASKIWPKGFKPLVDRLSEGLTALFCAGMAWLAFQYVSQSFEMGEVGVVTRIPVWVSQAILPWAFVSMSVRHSIFAIFPALRPTPTIEDIK